jgi:hypothetical protein
MAVCSVGLILDTAFPKQLSYFHRLVGEARLEVALRLEAQAVRLGWPTKLYDFGYYPDCPNRYLDELRTVVRASEWPGFLLVAGGAGALVQPHHLDAALHLCSVARGCVLANNVYSADVVGLCDRTHLDNIIDIRSTNDLAWALQRDAALMALPLPDPEVWDFDLDTPSDVSVLAFLGHTGVGAVPTAQVQRVVDRLADPKATLILVGRVSSRTMAALDRSARCQVRTLSEERGMKASGRDRIGLVKSVLVHKGANPVALAEQLLSVADALVLDTRFIAKAAGWTTEPVDLFAADWFATDEISCWELRSFVRELQAARTPALLGGHNLVNAGVRQLASSLQYSDLRGCAVCVA